MLSDIFDGVLARRFGVSTPALRRYDSVTDIAYYLCILASVGIAEPRLLGRNWGWVVAMLLSEAALALLGLVKFQRLASAHSYLAKFFGLALFAGLVLILAFNISTGVLPALAIIGMVVNVEIILMLLVSKKPSVDVLLIVPFAQGLNNRVASI